MTKYIYDFFGRNFEIDAFDNNLMTNKIGGFYYFSNAPFSKYQGLLFNEGMEVYKTIEAIRLFPSENLTQTKNKLYCTQTKRNDISEMHFMPLGYNAIFYEHDSDRKIEINLDCKKAYDGKTWGRFYEISHEISENKKEKTIIIKYIKKTDKAEDATHGNKEYEIYTAIVCDNAEFEILDKWYDEFYPFEFERNDMPKRSIYQALRINAQKIAIASSLDLEKAKKDARFVFENIQELIEVKKKHIKKLNHKKIKSKSIDVAHILSANALDSLAINEKEDSGFGIYAGLPWFFQFWTRDTAISLRAQIIAGNYDFAKKLLMDYIGRIRQDGWIENRIPFANLNSADSTGLVFLRLYDLIEILEQKKLLDKYFPKNEMKFIKEKLEETIYAILKAHSHSEFILNNKKETWMDTDTREGIRIEIQAMQLFLYFFLKKISKKLKDEIAYKFASHQEKNLLQKVRENFFHIYLYDGVNDPTIRPNFFLAYYIYPNLLSKKEWEHAFDVALHVLWLDWGGIASIDKEHPEFLERHTGTNDKSYHKGDSWYFLNNLAAICMYRLNSEKYKEQIEKILEASTNEILYRGILGYHAELSSAKINESKGCLAQAWSSATYIELIREILGD